MSHHLARRTFATTVLLYNDVPMEIVSTLLGHSTMSSHSAKLIYGHKITDRAVNPDGLTRDWVINMTYEVRF